MSLSSVPTDSGQHRLVLRLGGIGALCALVVFVLGMAWGVLAPNESTSELFILTTPIVTQILLIPTVGALYTIYRPTAPRLSWVMLGLAGVGLIGIMLLPILEVFHIPTNPMRGHPLLVGCLALLLANGLWPIIAGGLELTDPTPTFAGMGVVSMLAGGLFTLFILCIMTFSWRSLGTGMLLVFLLPVLVITHGVWLARMGYRFLIAPAMQWERTSRGRVTTHLSAYHGVVERTEDDRTWAARVESPDQVYESEFDYPTMTEAQTWVERKIEALQRSPRS